jgi:hypothetical protein
MRCQLKGGVRGEMWVLGFGEAGLRLLGRALAGEGWKHRFRGVNNARDVYYMILRQYCFWA